MDMIVHIQNDVDIPNKKKHIPSDNHGRFFFELDTALGTCHHLTLNCVNYLFPWVNTCWGHGEISGTIHCYEIRPKTSETVCHQLSCCIVSQN